MYDTALKIQDLMEREHRNQNAIEEERAGLTKMKEVKILMSDVSWWEVMTKLYSQDKNNEILGLNNEVIIFSKNSSEVDLAMYWTQILCFFLFQLARLQTRLEAAQSKAVKWWVQDYSSAWWSLLHT